MESPEAPGSPLEYDDDLSYPCKGCGLILEEGKAFELANNRWHIDCFRCNTCGTLLDSDANLLLLADGSLICNGCTYSCTACGNKIEDLAILTGDQAFCAGCFRCRNCKRKIENLKYARTSQGIFCMSCHESLMARRKKKQKSARQAAAAGGGSNAPSPMLALDKSLPAIPQQDDDEDDEPQPRPSLSETPTELSPRPAVRPPRTTSASTKSARAPELSPTYPPTTESTPRIPRPYNNNRHSQISHHSDFSELLAQHDQSDSFTSFIPLVLDPSPGHPPPLQQSTYRPESTKDTSIPQPKRPEPPRTYSNASDTPSYYETDKYEKFGRKPVPNSVPQAPAPSAHIAYQERGRQPATLEHEMERHSQEKKRPAVSTDTSAFPSRVSSRSAQSEMSVTPSKSTTASATDGQDKIWDSFKLGEVPSQRKKSITSARAPNLDDIPISFSPVRTSSMQAPYFSSPPQKEPSQAPVIPERSMLNQQKSTAYTPDQSTSSGQPNPSIYTSDRSAPPGQSNIQVHSYSTSGSNSSGNTTLDSSDVPTPKKETSNSSIKGTMSSSSTFLMDPKQSAYGSTNGRAANYRHSAHIPSTHKLSYSDSSLAENSPILPLTLRTPVGDFGADEDIVRILGQETSPSLLRKVSNAVRHGRSFSDLAGRIGTSPMWPRTSITAGYHGPYYGHEITSPTVPTESKDENMLLKNELRRSTLKIAELELKLHSNGPESAVEMSVIEEKKLEVAELESKRTTMLKELEVMFKGQEEDDWSTFAAKAINTLAEELQKVRDKFETEITEAIAKKDKLLEEIATLSRLRDQSIQETEQLNLKNAQLADLNNEITRQIQGKFQAHKNAISAPNGLGIMNRDGSDFLDGRKDGKQAGTAAVPGQHTHIPMSMQEGPDDDRVIIAQPTVINVGRKGVGPLKKSVWKKGGAAIIKGAGKGFNKVFSSDGQTLDPGQHQADSVSLMSTNSESPYLPRAGTAGDNHGGFEKIFNTQKFKMNKKNGSNTNFSTVNGSEVTMKEHMEGIVPLFGVELEVRAEYENKSIPHVVSRCIQEVEARGMDMEGIYRKTGGASSIRMIQESFEKGEDLDIGENIDISGVTSVLKQYFRKLPTPIITPAIYDEFLKTTKYSNDEQRIEEIKRVMGQLSMVNQDVLGYLIFHLKKVAEREKLNLMTTRNLAVVFAPTLMWHKDSDREMADMHEKNNAIQFLIEHGESIFFA